MVSAVKALSAIAKHHGAEGVLSGNAHTAVITAMGREGRSRSLMVEVMTYSIFSNIHPYMGGRDHLWLRVVGRLDSWLFLEVLRL